MHDYLVEDTDECFSVVVDQLVRLPHQDLLDFGRLAELLGYDRKLNTLDYPVVSARVPDPGSDTQAAANWSCSGS